MRWYGYIQVPLVVGDFLSLCSAFLDVSDPGKGVAWMDHTPVREVLRELQVYLLLWGYNRS